MYKKDLKEVLISIWLSCFIILKVPLTNSDHDFFNSKFNYCMLPTFWPDNILKMDSQGLKINFIW